MADNSPGGPFGRDPLGDRLRDTFEAERVDIERRLNAHDAPSTRSRSLSWIPFAAAATVLAIAGFLFIGNRGSDTAVDLDVAAQAGQGGGDTTVDGEGSVPPITPNFGPTPSIPMPAAPNVIPFLTGEWFCGESFDPDLALVWRADNSNSPATEIPGFEVGVTRQILSGTSVEPVGGCTAGTTGLGYGQWHEIRSLSGERSEWILREYLITGSDYQAWLRDGTPPGRAPTPPPNITQAQPVPEIAGAPDDFPAPTAFDPNNECGARLVPALFVWNIALDDPDGGLVAHTEIGVDAPVTRVLELDEVVTPTGACFLSTTGSPWREIIAPNGSTDWVSARFLNDQVAPACLEGEQYGDRIRNQAEPLIHVITAGDTLGAIAQRYNVFIDDLLAINPQLDPTAVQIGDQLQIPGAGIVDPRPEQILGPVDGLAIVDGDRTAFAPMNSQVYRWYDSTAIMIGGSCFGQAVAGQPACAYGDIALIDPQSPEPIWTGTGPIDVQTRGRTLPSQSPEFDWFEVTLDVNGAVYSGFIDNARTRIEFAPCTAGRQADDSFAVVPCNATDSDVVTGSTTRGSASSTANHVLNVRSEQGLGAQGPCVRIVIEFGSVTAAGERVPAAVLPLTTIEKSPELTRLVLPNWAGHPEQLTRYEEARNTVLLPTSATGAPALDVVHHLPAPVNVWFLENPARVIVDYLEPPAGFASNQPLGSNMLTRSSIHGDPSGPGVLEGTQITVEGYGRPFEASGLLRLYTIEGSDIANLPRRTTCATPRGLCRRLRRDWARRRGRVHRRGRGLYRL